MTSFSPPSTPAPFITGPSKPYGFKPQRQGQTGPTTRAVRTLQHCIADARYAVNLDYQGSYSSGSGNGVPALSQPLANMLGLTSLGNPVFINERTVYQPDPIITAGSVALFDFARMPVIPASINLMSSPDNWELTQAGNPFYNAASAYGNAGNTSLTDKTAASPVYNFSLYYNAPDVVSPVVMSYRGVTPLTPDTRLSFYISPLSALPGALLEVFLTGNTSGTPDFSLDLSTISSSGVYSDNNTAVSYTSRPLAVTDNPVIQVTPPSNPNGGAQLFAFELAPTYPASAVWDAIALGGGYDYLGNTSPSTLADAVTYAFKDLAVERSASVAYTSVYFPPVDYVNSGENQNTAPSDYPAAYGYAFNGVTANPLEDKIAGANLLNYPADWLEYGSNQSYNNRRTTAYPNAWDAIVGAYWNMDIYQTQAYALDGSGHQTSIPGWQIEYNGAPAAGSVIAFQAGGDSYNSPCTLNVFLNGDPTSVPDFTQELEQYQPVTWQSRALTTADRPIIQFLTSQSNALAPSYLIPIPPTVAVPATTSRKQTLQIGSLAQSLLGSYSPPAYTGTYNPSGTVMANVSSNNYLKQTIYVGITIYYVPDSNGSGTGTFFHVGADDYVSPDGWSTSANGCQPLITFGLDNGQFFAAAGPCNTSTIDLGNNYQEGFYTLGAVITPSAIQAGYIQLDFYLNGQYVSTDYEYNQSNGIAADMWNTLYEGFGSLSSYGKTDMCGVEYQTQPLQFTAHRLYVESLSTSLRSGSFVAYSDYFIGQSRMGVKRTIAANTIIQSLGDTALGPAPAPN